MNTARSFEVHWNSIHRQRAFRWLRLCIMGFALGWGGAWAGCVRDPGTLEIQIDMNMDTVYVDNSVAVGTVIASKSFLIPVRNPGPTGAATPFTFDCRPFGGTLYGVMLQGSPVPGLDHVYTTAVKGIGIRLSRYLGGAYDGKSTVYYPSSATYISSQPALYSGSYFRVELIKTDAVTGSGALASGTYTRYYGDGDMKSALTTTLSGRGITVITPSCKLDPNSVKLSVPLGPVPVQSFRSIGSVAGARTFDVKLQCSAGQNASNTVYLRMDAVKDPATNEPGVLKIATGPSAATGVGIQVLDPSKAGVAFGQDVKVGPSIDGVYTLTYTARYFQTGAKVTVGPANGAANLTISYK